MKNSRPSPKFHLDMECSLTNLKGPLIISFMKLQESQLYNNQLSLKTSLMQYGSLTVIFPDTHD